MLNKEEKFTFKSLVNDSTTEESLEKFSFPTVYNAINRFSPIAYMFVDLDADGVEEMLIAEPNLTFCLLLRYDNGTVYGNILEHIKYQYIGTDGSFMEASFDGKKRQICTVTFDGPLCKLETQAYIDEGKSIYQRDYKDAPQSDVEAYFAEWDKNTEKLTWVKIES